MESTRLQLPKLQNLNLQLNRLEDDFAKSDELKALDKVHLNQLGIFRSQLNKFKKEIYQANHSETIEEITVHYKNLFDIRCDIEFKKDHSLLEHLGELFFLIGTLGKIYDFTYGLGTLTSILSWTSIALGLFTTGFARMMDSVNLQIKQLDKIDQQTKKPLHRIIKSEKIDDFNLNAFHYLKTRVNFFKTNFKSINSIMLQYPTPTNVLRLMLDCYQAIQQSAGKERAEMKQMIDGCFAYLYIMNGKLDATQQDLYNEFYEEITSARNRIDKK